MTIVYAANRWNNKDFEVPWCKIGKTYRTVWKRLQNSIFSAIECEELELGFVDDAKVAAIEHLSHAIAAERFGHAPRTYISRNDGKVYTYHGKTETFLCNKDDGFAIICEANEWVNKALKSTT